MDSSPDLSVKLRRGSSDSNGFYMGFEGIDSDIEEVTTVQSNPPPPPYPAPEERPIDIPPPIESTPPAGEASPSEPEEFVGLLDDSERLVFDEQRFEEVIQTPLPIEPSQLLIEQIPPPPAMFDGDDDDETNTSVTVIQTKHKTPSSSSSSISSGLNELMADDVNKSLSHTVDSPKSRTQSVEAEIASPSSHKSPSSHRSPPSHKSPPKKLNLYKDTPRKNFDSDSIDSINAMDCKIDDDNRDDSSPTDSMPPAPTPPPLENVLSLEAR